MVIYVWKYKFKSQVKGEQKKFCQEKDVNEKWSKNQWELFSKILVKKTSQNINRLVDIILYWSTNAFAIRGECAFEYLMRRKARERIFTLGKPFRTFAVYGDFLRLRMEKHFARDCHGQSSTWIQCLLKLENVQNLFDIIRHVHQASEVFKCFVILSNIRVLNTSWTIISSLCFHDAV